MQLERRVWSLGAVLVVILLTGCAGLGPSQAAEDRIGYNTSLTSSWKRQLLLNIVKIRYVEPLFFMDVGEIVASYSLETSLSAGLSRTLFEQAGAVEFGVEGKYTDRPTITFRPLTGPSFMRGVMSPMPLGNILLSVESGASAAFIFNLGVRSINGLRNERLTPQGYQPPDPDFTRAVELIASLQADNAMHVVRFAPQPDQPPRLFLEMPEHAVAPSASSRAAELKKLLGLDPDKDRFALGFGAYTRSPDAIVLQTYSLAQMLAMVAGRVDVPEEDLASHRATPGPPLQAQAGLFDKTMVRSSPRKPQEAFASVHYRGAWFWVDDHDLAAKRVFSFIMLAFTMLDTGQQESQIQLTIPTQ
ncbi:MAG: hypothetical protein ACOCVM_07135 [Desulfovibrionaceae bacterium]